MREREFYKYEASNAKRQALLLGQFEFLQTRQEAVERVVNVSSFVDRVKWLFWPRMFWTVVDAVQTGLLNKRAELRDKAAKRPKIDVVGAL